MDRLWVTGASGFVGRRLCALAAVQGWKVLASSRDVRRLRLPPAVEAIDLDATLAAPGAKTIDVVIHAAARAHQLRDDSADPAAEFHRVNVELSLAVARAAHAAGARRFVYVSSIGVNGDATDGRPFTEADSPRPVEPYAVSKLQAEDALKGLCAQLGLALVVVRPPLVYGKGAPGNFARLLKLAGSGWPLPLAAIDNRRSFVAVQNLCDFLLLAARHDAAAGELFLISDGEDLSTPRLLQVLADAAGRPARLWSLPPGLLRLATSLLGQRKAYEKLCGSLQVDSGKARRLLGWHPVVDTEAGLKAWVHESFAAAKS